MFGGGELFQVAIRKTFRVSVVRLALLLQCMLFASVTWGQDAATGALRGIVLDAQGAGIVSADVVAIRIDTGMRYHSATDSAGRFVVDVLPPGEYSARAEADGMSPQVSPMIRVEVGAATQVTFKLKVAGPREKITVSEAPRVGDPNPGSVSGLVDERTSAARRLRTRKRRSRRTAPPSVWCSR